jgi:hypothetical protein
MKLELKGSIETRRREEKIKRCRKGSFMHIMRFYEHIIIGNKSEYF